MRGAKAGEIVLRGDANAQARGDIVFAEQLALTA